jgi:predicted nucleotidyltransferase
LALAAKIEKNAEFKEIIYSSGRWTLLKEYRWKAAKLMASLESSHIQSIVHGSIARGDVTAKSDIDIFIPEPPSSFLVERALEKTGISFNVRYVVQATPNYAMKAHIEIEEKTTVSFPLMWMRKVEREFYRFGGELGLSHLQRGSRTVGVDKRLMLIEPTLKGHIESSIVGREEQTGKILGVSVETIMDRVHALLKRDEVGRTGVFAKKELNADETFELALKKLAKVNPAVRRRIERGSYSSGG